jgi:phosphohistidine phosphatase SixA
MGAVVEFRAAAPAAQDPAGPSTITYVVRHAERADDSGAPAMAARGSDPPLSEAGRARAVTLASLLRDVGLVRILTSEYARTRQTAEPLADATGLEIESIEAGDSASLMRQLALAPGPVLVVGHSNTVPGILKALGVAEPIVIADDEYDNLFVVVRVDGAAPILIRLRYPVSASSTGREAEPVR